MITTQQKAYIREAIIDVSSVQFQDFYEIMNDRYLNSIETQMAEGKDFETAFHQIHDSFLSQSYSNIRYSDRYEMTYYGLEAMQWQQHDKINTFAGRHQWQIIKSYFKFPAIIAVFLSAVLVFKGVEMLREQVLALKIIVIVMVFLPLLITVPLSLKSMWGYYIKKNRALLKSIRLNVLIRRASGGNIGLTLSIVQISFIDQNSPIDNFILGFWSIMAFGFLVYSVSLLQLYIEQRDVKIVP